MNATATPAWVPYASLVTSFVALVGLVFTVIKTYRLEGGRVVVSFDPGVWNPGIGLFHVVSKNGSMVGIDGKLFSRDDKRRGVECAVVTVENASRTGLTILNVGVSFKGRRIRRRLWRRSRNFIAPRCFRSKSHGVATFDREHDPIRLEPYSQAVYLMDVHSVIDAARQELLRRRKGGFRQVNLRASVKVAGRRNPIRSRYRRRWRVPGDAASLFGYSRTIPVESLISLELARNLNAGENPDEENSSMEPVSRFIAASLWDTRASTDLAERIDTALDADGHVRYFFEDRPAVHMVHYELRKMLTDRVSVLDWAGARKQSELSAKARTARTRSRERRSGDEFPNRWLP